MAKIQCPKDYNYWYILNYAGIDGSIETEKYHYDAENEELSADVNQDILDNALNQYNHDAWLQELEQIKNPRKKEQILEERLQTTEDALMFLMDMNLMGGM